MPAEARKPEGKIWGGLAYCLAIAVLSYLSNLYLYNRISPLMWAFIYSIILANLFTLSGGVLAGAGYASSQLLRFSIVVFGFTVSALAWAQVGLVGLLEVLIVVVFALVSGLLLGRVLNLEDSLSSLIAGGTGICGATAIAALGPSIEARDEEMGMAVTCVTLFGLVAMFLYPFLFQNSVLGGWLRNSDLAVSFAGVGSKVRFNNFSLLGWRAFVAGLSVAFFSAVLALLLVVYLFIPASGL